MHNPVSEVHTLVPVKEIVFERSNIGDRNLVGFTYKIWMIRFFEPTTYGSDLLNGATHLITFK